ncbi:DUF3365 domain-containing protein [bacterium]|nr:DUF3365 domain-containing protein [bacterium]
MTELDEKEDISITRGGIRSLALVWTMLVALSFAWFCYTQRNLKEEYALNEARESFKRELLLMDWLTGKRDTSQVQTPFSAPQQTGAGVTAATLDRLRISSGHFSVACFGVTGAFLHLTSQQPLDEENRPDDWEREALVQLAGGSSEVHAVARKEGHNYLRFMGPVKWADECSTCHGGRDGVQNGLSISLPLDGPTRVARMHLLETGLSYLVLWVIGLSGLLWVGLRFGRQRRVHSEVQRELTRIRSAVECASEAILITDESGQAVYTNPAFILLFSRTLEDMKSGGIDALFDEPAAATHVTDILDGKLDFWEGEVLVLATERRQIPAWCRFSRIYDSGGFNDGMRLMFTDMTETKKNQEESLKRERLSAALALAGATCHEINQPLQAALGYSELAIMNAKACTCGKSNTQSLVTIREQVLRVADIVKKLHGISRYRTADYVGKSHIVDLEKSSSTEPPGE